MGGEFFQGEDVNVPLKSKPPLHLPWVKRGDVELFDAVLGVGYEKALRKILFARGQTLIAKDAAAKRLIQLYGYSRNETRALWRDPSWVAAAKRMRTNAQ